MEGVRNGAAKEDGRWDLNPGAAAIEKGGPRGSEGKGRGSSEVNRGPCGSGVNRKDHAVLKERREDHMVLEGFFLPHGLGSRRDFARKIRGERTLAGGP